MVTYLIQIINGGCNNHCTFLVKEGFSNFDESKQYFDNLTKRCDVINNNILSLSTKIGDLENSFGRLKTDVCYITNQIDEGLAGNYASYIPEEEMQYKPDIQKKRASLRKINSFKQVANLKKTFVEAHDGTPLLECFADQQDPRLMQIRDDLNTKISDVQSNLTLFDDSLASLKKEFAKDKLQQYYTTLNYNDKYIKQMQSAAYQNKEGFDTETDVLDFKPSKANVADSKLGPEKRVDILEEHYKKSVKLFDHLNKTFMKYRNTIKVQTEQIKMPKKIVYDKKKNV